SKTHNSFLISLVLTNVYPSFKFKKHFKPPCHKPLIMFVLKNEHVIGIKFFSCQYTVKSFQIIRIFFLKNGLQNLQIIDVMVPAVVLLNRIFKLSGLWKHHIIRL